MNKKTVDDECLIRAAQKGVASAFNLLLERYRAKIQQTLYFYLNDSSQVNDLTQEVLFKVFRHLPYFKEESSFPTWLHRIILNTLKNHFRSICAQDSLSVECIYEDLVSTNLSPEHQLISLELGEQVESALSRLSAELKLCYGMHVFEGQSYDEIAKVMDCPIGTVRSRIFRARKLMIDYVGYNLHG
ncbi:MAG: sigma-70 family RNA polymerase sigma factor [Legionella sp.]